ncbi:hypothetical protein KR51_00014840, partial [Rubidibacter lacunae KORDI 51-2]
MAIYAAVFTPVKSRQLSKRWHMCQMSRAWTGKTTEIGEVTVVLWLPDRNDNPGSAAVFVG